MENKFTNILEKNEKIIGIYRPSTGRFWGAGLVSAIFKCLVATAFFFFFYNVASNVFGPMGDDFANPFANIEEQVPLLIGFFAILLVAHIIYMLLLYKKRYYAYTNKRVIIRAGVIGVDYKSLEYKNMTATIVNVDILDKIFMTGTGRIEFGSAATPIGVRVGMISSNPYQFKWIKDPYNVMRDVKEQADKSGT